jgi:VanZ family protein
VALYVCLIFGLSSIRGLQVPGSFPFMDKVAHLMEYSLFGLLVGRAIRFTMSGSSRVAMSIAAISVGAFVGMCDEIYQRFVPGRSSDVFDWLTDVTAVTLAVVITQVVSARPLGRRAAPER